MVLEGGGGGFWSCEAVGALEWRIEYVRCIVKTVNLRAFLLSHKGLSTKGERCAPR